MAERQNETRAKVQSCVATVVCVFPFTFYVLSSFGEFEAKQLLETACKVETTPRAEMNNLMMPFRESLVGIGVRGRAHDAAKVRFFRPSRGETPGSAQLERPVHTNASEYAESPDVPSGECVKVSFPEGAVSLRVLERVQDGII